LAVGHPWGHGQCGEEQKVAVMELRHGWVG
jgi:hypothetical protein